uniref:cytoskeleton-associated protein 5-like n=1 Tax=Ciona intestinalis TaxID=7719 RepID=UPI00089DCF1F|nr:cytoskeleton-associated protein 5-like [Ciona intestinalis]|eukprot:XP_018670649.1 cytoskeleton-associated protein 5-like [Ciona intestinalis]
MLVTISIKCIGALANGLRKKFQSYAHVCIEGMLERFKEKKPNVVAALQEAIDAVFATTNLAAILETIIEFLAHKNPAIRAQTGLFLSRALLKTKSSVLNKATIKTIVAPLLKNIEHSAPDVRDGAFLSFGAILKVAGESKLLPFLADLDKLKMEKITECAGKLDGGKPSTSAGASKPAAPVKKEPEAPTRPKSAAPKSAAAKPKADGTKKVVKGGKKPASQSAKSAASVEPAVEQELGDAAVDDLIASVITDEERAQILNNNWKERLAGLQSMFSKIKGLDRSSLPCQAIVKLLSMKPGLKDNNFNCLNEKFNILVHLAQNGKFSRTSAGVCLTATIDKVGDVKCGVGAKATLTAVSEAVGFGWTLEEVLAHAMSQKNPKIQSESISWVAKSIIEFGITGLNIKMLIEKSKVAFTATNPAVRAAALSLVGSLAMFIGGKLHMLFENEKPALLQQIDAEIEKVKGQSPPAPTRGVKKKSGSADVGEQSDEDVEEAGITMDDLVTRVDISGKITDALISQMADKNWKERKEALESVIEILNEAKFVTSDIGDLATGLKARLTDSNKILLTTTLNILTQLATALGPHSAKHLQILSANIINTLADSKPQVRQAALKCMNTWLENTKLSMWLEGDMISSALSVAKHTFLRIELLTWLAEKLLSVAKLPSSAKEGLEMCVPVIYSCCEDRSGEVRAKAQGFLPAIMRHISYDKMIKGTGKLTATSKPTIITLLEKAREQIPAPTKVSKPAPSVSPPSASEVKMEVKSEEPATKPPAAKEKKGLVKKSKPAPVSKKAQPEEDTTPLFISLPNGKEQRMKDEIKLKTIKWNFTAPREELIVQLQTQLSTCVSPALITEMFHLDFQHHLKAIVMLNQALDKNFENTMQCLDLLLRWLTLRFYDKNTTVHIKTLEYIKSLFDKLIEGNYRMPEYEVSAFLPHLIIKIGESKDNIRKAVHGIIKQLSLIYPASKLFTHIMDGTKSKNSRQRSECLDEIALFIETHGVNVCQPSLPKALKEVATNIGDRDKSVRSSALNAIVAAYNVCGDVVFKHVGRLNEKDMSMLEERVKRSGKYGETPAAPPPEAPARKTTKEGRSASTNNERQQQQQQQAAPPSHTIQESMHDLHSSGNTMQTDPMKIPSVARLLSQIKPVDFNVVLEPLPEFVNLKSRIPGLSNIAGSSQASSTVDAVISQVASPNIDTAINAMHELYQLLKHKDKFPLLAGKIDQVLMSATTQLRMMIDRYLPIITSNEQLVGEEHSNLTEQSFLSLCKSHISLITEIFEQDTLASQASTYILFDLFRFILQLLLSDQLPNLTSADRLLQVLNILVLRMIDHSDPTSIICAVVHVLTDSMETATPKYIELVVKCLWKLGRLISKFLHPEKQKEAFQHKPLKVAAVVAELDKYWSTYPKDHPIYEKNENKTSIRSVKTLLVILCRELGVKIMDELYMIPNPESSEVVQIIRKASGAGNMKIPNRPNSSSSSEQKENIREQGLSPDAQLSIIFKKVSDRKQTKQGLQELYDFKVTNPHYDLESRINSLDIDIFQQYIRRNLKRIESEKQTKSGAFTESQKSNYQPPTVQESWDRLNYLRERCGLKPRCTSEKQNGEKTTTDVNHPEPSGESSTVKADEAAVRSSGFQSQPKERSISSSANISDLKRRLAQIKQSSSR